MESDIQASYNELLEHNCFKCKKENKVANFRTFALLKDHMRREHELHYCDLCVENLKVSYFKKCYLPNIVKHTILNLLSFITDLFL